MEPLGGELRVTGVAPLGHNVVGGKSQVGLHQICLLLRRSNVDHKLKVRGPRPIRMSAACLKGQVGPGRFIGARRQQPRRKPAPTDRAPRGLGAGSADRQPNGEALQVKRIPSQIQSKVGRRCKSDTFERIGQLTKAILQSAGGQWLFG